MLHLIPLTLEQLWDFYFFSVITGALKDPISVCVFLQHLGCVHAVYVMSWWTPATSFHQSTHTRYKYLQMLLWHRVWGVVLPIPRQVGTVWSRSRRRNWTARECVCKCAYVRVSVPDRACVCVSTTVHLQCFCVYTYMHMRWFVHAHVHEPDKWTGGWVCLSVEFWSNVMPMCYMPPLLFVLITERFT